MRAWIHRKNHTSVKCLKAISTVGIYCWYNTKIYIFRKEIHNIILCDVYHYFLYAIFYSIFYYIRRKKNRNFTFWHSDTSRFAAVCIVCYYGRHKVYIYITFIWFLFYKIYKTIIMASRRTICWPFNLIL